MTRLQWITILAAALLFAGLYFGFDTKPKDHLAVETKRAIEGTATDLASLESEAQKAIAPTELARLDALAANADAEKDEKAKLALLKELASGYFQAGSPVLSGKTADQIAEIEKTDAAWSIAGATWQIAGTNAKDQATHDFCGKHAIAAFENAVSIKPEEVAHQVNLAAVYADFPLPENPMKAVLMLRDLEAKNPENPLVYNALGRLAIKTNQWDRAIARFEKTISIDPKNKQANCLLADAYRGAKQDAKAAEQEKRCAQLTNQKK